MSGYTEGIPWEEFIRDAAYYLESGHLILNPDGTWVFYAALTEA